MTHPRSAFGAPPQGGAASGPAKPVPRRPLASTVELSDGLRRRKCGWPAARGRSVPETLNIHGQRSFRDGD